MLLIVAKRKKKKEGEPKGDAGRHISMNKQVPLVDEMQYFLSPNY